MDASRILIVSYLYPPAGGIGVQRALSLSRYLPDSGFEVHVLTAWNPAAPVRDEKLLKLVPPAVRIHKAVTPEPPFYFRKKLWRLASALRSKKEAGGEPAARRGFPAGLAQRILCPDPQRLWVPFAMGKARRMIRRHGIGTVLATAPPFSVFLISNALKREFPGLKVVSDFRDEWLRFYLTDFEFLRSDYTVKRATEIERETVERSDLVIAVTRSSLDEIRSRYPEQPAGKFVVISNGYDPAAFEGVARGSHGIPGVMVVTHTGTAYRTASPKYYLEAVDSLPERIRGSIETRFIGRIAESESRTLAGRRSRVKLLGFLAQQDALRLTAETDYLLLTMTNDFSLPGKMFEYLAVRKPILALSPARGEVDRLIAETSSGWCVNPEDPAAIRAMVTAAWERLQHRPVEFAPDEEAIARYERPRLAARMAEEIRGRGK